MLIIGKGEEYPVRREFHKGNAFTRVYINIDFIHIPIFRVQTRADDSDILPA